MKILIAYREIPQERIERLRQIAPEHRVVTVTFPRPGGDRTPSPELIENLADAHVLFGFFMPPNLLDLAPNLRWIQIPAAGIERFVSPQMATARLTITNAAGSSSDGIAEYALGGMLWFAKGLDRFAAQRKAHHYTRYSTSTLAGKTVAIVGLGAIGRDVARLCHAFGMRVHATRRNLSAETPAYVDQMFAPDDVLSLLGSCDYAVLSMPMTPETRRMIGARELAALPSHAVLINVARGGVIDEPALVETLREQRIRGAVLDVFEREPLPEDSPLWDLENVWLTPHVSGDIEQYPDRVFGIFEDNLRRFLDGQPLRNVVNLQLGY